MEKHHPNTSSIQTPIFAIQRHMSLCRNIQRAFQAAQVIDSSSLKRIPCAASRRELSVHVTTSERMGGNRNLAPLSSESLVAMTGARPVLKGVVFDVDGTLCEPQNYMFTEMRAVLQIPKSVDILDHIYSLPQDEQEGAMNAVRNIEKKAMQLQQPQAGLQQLMDYLSDSGIRKGICTRNFNAPVDHLLSNFLPSHVFWPIITRDFRPPKPDPAGILHIATEWARLDKWAMPSKPSTVSEPGIPGPLTNKEATSDKNIFGGDDDDAVTSAALRKESVNAQKGAEIDIIMVGDSVDDMTAGYRAGAITILLVNDANKHLATHPHTDLVVNRLDDLITILKNGLQC